MKLSSFIALALCLCLVAPASAQALSQTLPAGFLTIPGTSSTAYPVNSSGDHRWQWHYDSSEFAQAGPITIMDISIRSTGSPVASFNFPNWEVMLGTAITDYQVVNHDPIFDNNWSGDQIIAYSGGWTGSDPTGGQWIPMGLTVPFVYDPANGDFIVQIRNCSPVTIWGTSLDGKTGSAGTVGGNRYGNTSSCTATTQSFNNNEFVPLVKIDYVLGGSPLPPDYETNDDEGMCNIDGLNGSLYQPRIVNLNAYNCVPPVAATGTLNVGTEVNASGAWEIAMSNAAIVPLSGPGIMLGTEIFNLSVISTISFVNGGSTLSLDPWTGATFPGATGTFLSVPFSLATVTDMAMQAVIIAPASPTGFVLTQPTELHVAVSAAATSAPGPTADDTNVIYDVTTVPNCWFPNGVSFNGTIYNEIAVSPNGRVLFSSTGDSDFSPTALEALGDAPFYGFWTDFNPLTAGTITLNNPSPSVLRVDYTGIAYDGEAGAPCTFGIELDDVSQVFSIDGLGGIVANPITNGTPGSADAQFLGLSVGNIGGATNAGITTFSSGGGGLLPAPATDMIYDYYDYLSGVGGLVNSLVTSVPPLTELQFNFVSGTGWLWSGL